jgi:hypothetical protein
MVKRIDDPVTEKEILKERAMKDLKRDYPGVPEHFLELAYDFCTDQPERAERIMNGEEDMPPPKDRKIMCS